MEEMDFVIKLSAFAAAILALLGAAFAVFKWFQKQDQQSKDIEELKKHHEEDMKAAK